MYANSPTNWTPVPLPDKISAASTPHTNNIRAEIEQAAKLFDVDVQMMNAFAKIEFAYNPKARTGSYKCLFQLSNGEFAKYWHGDIYDIRDCSIAAARKFATEAAQFEKDMGRRATAAELYCIHQQGYEGCAFHYDAPQQLAWKNMYLTTEGQEKGAKWARKAIWGNVPWDLKKTFKGGVEALTSGQFIALWTERVNRFIARKVEPPTYYVQRAKVKKPTKLAAIRQEEDEERCEQEGKDNPARDAVTIVVGGVSLGQRQICAVYYQCLQRPKAGHFNWSRGWSIDWRRRNPPWRCGIGGLLPS